MTSCCMVKSQICYNSTLLYVAAATFFVVSQACWPVVGPVEVPVAVLVELGTTSVWWITPAPVCAHTTLIRQLP